MFKRRIAISSTIKAESKFQFFFLDPHPGNILLVYDANGKPQIGLIDYGQVKSLTKKQRLLLCKLIIALAEDNRDAIIELMKEAG